MMKRDYEYQVVVRDLSQFSKIYLIPLSDFHVGCKDSATDVIQGYIDWIKNHSNAYTILNGDLMNCAGKDTSPELFEDLCTPDQAYSQLVELISPIKNRILMITRGGHEGAIFRKVGADYSARLAHDLGDIPYHPDGGMVGVKLSLYNHPSMFWIYATHGWGGARTIGAKVKKVQDLAQVADVDAYILSHDHCISEDTEILTEFGWKSHNHCCAGEKALTYNMGTRELEYQLIEAIHQYSDFTEMLNVKSRSVDALVTPQHAMILKNHDGRRWHKETAMGMSARKGAIRLPQAGFYKAKGVPLDDGFISLVGWVISEGHFHKDSAGIRISQLKGKHLYIMGVLDILEISYRLVWTKARGKDYAIFNIPASDGKWIREIVSEKRVPNSFGELTSEQFRVFLISLCRGDGSWNGWNWTYATADSVLAGQLQALGIKHGYRVTDTMSKQMHNIYFVRGRSEVLLAHGKPKATPVPYNGIAWCVTVPNGTIVTRRNGKILIMGNTQNINRLNVLRPPRSNASGKRAMYMEVDRKVMVNTGAFVRYDGYIRRKGYVPTDMGTPRILMEIKKKGQRFEKDIHASL